MITYTIEPIRHLLKDRLEELTKQHWEEVGPDHETLSFDPDWQEGIEAEDQNRMRWFCVRNGGLLVGYIGAWIVRSTLQKGCLVAVLKDLFIEKPYRGLSVVLGLFRYAIGILKQLGISKIMIYEPIQYNNAGVLYKRIGFHEDERVWAMNL